MNARVLEKVGESVAAEAEVDLTQEMVRIDSTQRKRRRAGPRLETRLNRPGIGKIWSEKTFEGRLNTFWEVDSGRSGPRLLFTGHLDTKPVCEG